MTDNQSSIAGGTSPSLYKNGNKEFDINLIDLDTRLGEDLGIFEDRPRDQYGNILESVDYSWRDLDRFVEVIAFDLGVGFLTGYGLESVYPIKPAQTIGDLLERFDAALHKRLIYNKKNLPTEEELSQRAEYRESSNTRRYLDRQTENQSSEVETVLEDFGTIKPESADVDAESPTPVEPESDYWRKRQKPPPLENQEPKKEAPEFVKKTKSAVETLLLWAFIGLVGFLLLWFVGGTIQSMGDSNYERDGGARSRSY